MIQLDYKREHGFISADELDYSAQSDLEGVNQVSLVYFLASAALLCSINYC
jgi:hypothetical protein